MMGGRNASERDCERLAEGRLRDGRTGEDSDDEHPKTEEEFLMNAATVGTEDN